MSLCFSCKVNILATQQIDSDGFKYQICSIYNWINLAAAVPT